MRTERIDKKYKRPELKNGALITFRLPAKDKQKLQEGPLDISWVLRDLVKQYLAFGRIKRLPKEI